MTESAFWAALPALRKACGDRAVLRAIHYFEENARTLAQRDALQAGQVCCLCSAGAGKRTRILCAMPECLLQHRCAASGAFGGTGAEPEYPAGQHGSLADAGRRLCRHHSGVCSPETCWNAITARSSGYSAQGSCYILRLREQGAVKVDLKQQKEQHLQCDMYCRCVFMRMLVYCWMKFRKPVSGREPFV